MDRYWRLDAVAAETGLRGWQAKCAQYLGILPAPADARGWSTAQVEQIHGLVPEIVERVGTEPPLGATKCARRLAERLMIGVTDADIRVLHELGHLEVVDIYTPADGGDQGWALFALHKVDALPASVVDPVIVSRLRGTTATLSDTEACAELGWPGGTLHLAVIMNRIRPNLVGRFTREDVAALAADTEFGQILSGIRPRTTDDLSD